MWMGDSRTPAEDIRMKLSRPFKPGHLTNALRELYPRLTNAGCLGLSDDTYLSRPSPMKPGGALATINTRFPLQPRQHESVSFSGIPHSVYTPRTPRIASYAQTLPVIT